MEETTSIIKTKENPFTTVTPISKFVALLIFVALPFAGFYLGYKYQDKILTIKYSNEMVNKVRCDAEKPEELLVNSPALLLMEKQIQYKKLFAYRLKSNPKANVFVITPTLNQSDPVIFSTADINFDETSLFETIGNDVWVVSAQTNSIDVYTFTNSRNEGISLLPGYFTFKESLALPKYEIGTVYSIKCTQDTCAVKTAFHQESGCDMNLSIDTRKFSSIVCHAPGPYGKDYSPEPPIVY